MPLATARISRERTLSTLVRNLFVIEGLDAADKTRRAEAALLRANPHLADRENFAAGTVVAVPSDIGLKRTERVAARTEGLGGLLSESAERLDLLLALARDRLKAETVEAKDYLARIDDTRFRRAVASQSPDGEKLLEAARKAQGERAETVDARLKALAEATDGAQAEIKRLMELAKGR
jgi:hypothetical protein